MHEGGHYEDIRLQQEFEIERKVVTSIEHELHTHDALEISVVVNNNVIYTLDQQAQTIAKPGDVYILRPFEAHWNLAEREDKPAEWIMLLFSPSLVRNIPNGFQLLAPFYTMGWNPLIPSDAHQAKSIHAATYDALHDQEINQPGKETKIWLHMIHILLLIYQYYRSCQQEKEVNLQTDEGIIRAIERILKDYNSEIHMDEIIDSSGLKKTWFYQQFYRMTALTPNDFINRLRIQHACLLLHQTNKSATDIAYESGFQSLSYFHKMFKKYKNMTPKIYRQAK